MSLWLLLLRHPCHQRLNDAEMQWPASVVQYRPHVESIVVGRVGFGVVGGRDRGHLVSVNGIVLEKSFDTLSNGTRCHWQPFVYQLPEHGYWSHLITLAQLTKPRQFCVRDIHVRLVRLHVIATYWFKFCSRRGVNKLIQHGHVPLGGRPRDKFPQIRL